MERSSLTNTIVVASICGVISSIGTSLLLRAWAASSHEGRLQGTSSSPKLRPPIGKASKADPAAINDGLSAKNIYATGGSLLPLARRISSSSSSVVIPPRRLDPYDPRPREGYMSWDDYFITLAFLSAQRSKDPSKQVGACIVDSNQVILGIGYNGFPRGCSDGDLPWSKKHPDGPLGTKYPYVVHAEANALLNKNAASVAGAKVYVTLFPCGECAKLLIQAGISEVIYHEGKVHQPSRRQSRAASHSGGDDSGALPSEPSPAPQGSCAEHHHHHHHDHHAMGIGCLNTRGPAPVPSLAARGPPSSGATNLESPAALGEPPLGTASTAHTALPLLHDDGPMLSLSGFPLPRPSLSGAEVVDPTYLASMKLFQLAGVKLRQHRLMGSVTIVPS